MIENMFQDGTDKVLDDRVARPVAEPPVRPSFGLSLWNTTKSLPKGVATGATESAAFGSDMLGAFGAVQAGYGVQADPAMLFDSDMQQRVAGAEGQKAREDVQSGAAFTSQSGTGLRATARTMMPDPTTSNAAENILFGLGRFGVKAVAYSVLGTPIPGAVFTGTDEAFVEAQRLQELGVDFETRTKAAIAAGGAAAAATALPVAGKTIGQTVGLVAAGGPGTFIAQQAASRAILQNAGYDKIAEQYDPFDPVGLAVATLIPAGFGAYASRGMRNARPVAAPMDAAASRELVQMGMNERQALRYDDARLDAYAVTAAQRVGVPPEVLLAAKNAGERSSSSAATSPVGAKGIMQFMDATWQQYGKGNVRDPVASIDAGAAYLADLGKQYGGDWRAALAHYNGGTLAGKAVQAGKVPPAAETRAYLERTDKFIAERQGTEAGRAAAADPEAVAAARVNLIRETVNSWNLKDQADIAGAEQHLAAFSRAADQLGAGERVAVSDTLNLDNLAQARMLDDFGTRMEAVRATLLEDAGNVAEPGAIRAMRDEITSLQQSIPATNDAALRARAKEIQAEGGSYKQALATATKELNGRAAEINQRIDSLQQQIDRNALATRANEQIAQLDQQIAQVRQQRAAIDAPTPKRGALAVQQALAEPPAKGAKSGTAEPGASAATKAPEAAPPAPKTATERAPGGTSTAETGTSGGQAGTAAAVLDSQTAEIARLSPDMVVQLEGMDAPLPLAEALAKVKEEAAAEAKDAGLLQVAAECFLRNS
ncbi:lytic transglycosylase domain-containing protein [Herbaspirillum sp. C7C8]|uniref:lytic transglycosylase domain-containing protein n=1 Tax=Herbaspirillum sp. C7C8 TaxID=2736665 RepID=UPI001F51D102|nr:lytic transglycosylase domain-containing protein [Herbaspirillum sp. C7C8]MCI1005205.1 transglycosylase SLT domain-containing protein [Herbaspirillum sp. C7C8]